MTDYNSQLPQTDWTIREIHQQPAMWRQVLEDLADRRQEIDAWLAPLLAMADLRIVLTGAGSSAYIGEAAAPELTRMLGRLVEPIATTSIVGFPFAHLDPDRPTLMVSFARSGNSPESLAAVEVANTIVRKCWHLVICCNKDSELARGGMNGERTLSLFMPEPTLDQSFAMTSSFSSMLVCALELFAPGAARIAEAGDVVSRLLGEREHGMANLIYGGISRAVFLGTGGFQGIATEAALKMLELSAGRTNSYCESPLGFRHGPKFVIDSRAVVIMLISNDPHARRYDQDLFVELESDGLARAVVRLDELNCVGSDELTTAALGLVYLVWCQLLAYENCRTLGISPDNPCPGGQVNRVVQGVRIHPLVGQQV